MDIALLGTPRLVGGLEAPKYLERKTAALLAYLALEGATARWRLAGLLWPESSEATARNNLRQLLRRLRELAGTPCVQGREPLMLEAGLSMDVALLVVAHETGDRERVAAFTGELLEGHAYDDCSALDDWLRMWRLRLRRMRFEALDTQVRRHEQGAGQLTVALEMARRLVDLEPTSEEAHQHVMRLLHRLGDRGAALAAWQQCREVLRRELDVEPSESTRQLARDIERHEAGHRLPARPGKRAVPLSVLHPPLLVGREREWEQLEDAWASRRNIFVEGDAGIGKSRLLSDFARSKGRWVLLAARPGDLHLPFATHIRSLRALLARKPQVHLEPWARRELSRLMPELEPHARLGPARTEEKPRLHAAVFALLRETAADLDSIFFDDAHYIDPDSAELGMHVQTHFMEETARGRFPLVLHAHRPFENDLSWRRDIIDSGVSAGVLVRIPLSWLTPPAVRDMLHSMGVPGLEGVAEKVGTYAGGSPLFIVETVRHLLESHAFEGRFPESMPPPERVRSIIEHRLGRLSPAALRLARVFAVAQTDFSAELAAAVLEVPVDELHEPWRQLEDAHVVRGRWFTHDVVGEVLLASMPEPIRASLQERIARSREEAGNPALARARARSRPTPARSSALLD
ncbi:AAA family ATPase [Pyxidicoccus trucidator]|uniref:AAA family ATPase n=1 Tax=Pyxidicoccus trucidator TaxID=2709662 RepID=UPI0013DA5CCB|nr:AAA family ATPase [Pyxidicoccus trucidator]